MARRRRKDPIDIPVDGDLRNDVVINKNPEKAYALVSADDLNRMVQRGYVPTPIDDPARPMFGDITGEKMVGGQLRLMETSKERAEAIQRAGEKEFARRTAGLNAGIRQHVADNPGSKFTLATEN